MEIKKIKKKKFDEVDANTNEGEKEGGSVKVE
jgi:hypothetical protein